MYCRDFFAEEIADEAEYAANDEYDPNNGWYTKTFVDSTWSGSICPNTTNLELLTYESYLAANVYSCEDSATWDDSEGTTPYSDATCETND